MMDTSPAATAHVCPQCGVPLASGSTAHGICPRCAWLVLDEGEASDEDMISLPGLRVKSEISRGGMGVVYRAVEAEAGREVAVKMMQPALADTAETRERFAQEARAMGALDHPGILPVYRVGEYHGLPFFSMKLAEGGTLAQRLGRYADDWRAIAALMAGLAEAVHHAHQRGLLHRDLKPANILFDAAARAYVSDFGLVKMAGIDSSLTRSVSVLGTPHYMAPEVAERDARAASVASDVWSLGAMLYELIAQRLAFQAEGVPALLRRIVEEDPAPLPPAVPRDLATITLKCLQKNATRRYASAGDLADDLKRWLKGEPVAARRMSAARRLVYWSKRKPALAAMWVLLLVTLLTSAVLILAKNRELKSTLRTALINEAHAIRAAARVQQRDAGLTAIGKAARLGSSPDLEEEAASLLALPSMTLAAKIDIGRNWQNLIPDSDLKNAVDFTHEDGVRIVDILSRKELAKLPPGKPASPMREAFSEDGRFVIDSDPSGEHLVVCEWRTGRILRQIEWKAASHARFSPDGQTFAVGHKDGRIELYDLENTAAPPVVWPGGTLVPAKPMAFSPDGRWLAVRDDTHLLSVFDVRTGDKKSTFGIRGEGPVLSACWFPNSEGLLLGTTYGMVRSWSLEGGPSRALPGHAAQVFGVAVQPEGQLAFSSAYEGRSWILDWPSGRVIGMEPGNSLLTRFSHDGKRLALVDEELRLLKLYEVASSEVCRQFVSPDVLAGKYMKKGSWCAQVRPGGRLLATVNYGSTDIFDLATARPLGALPEGSGTTLAWSADGNELWIGNGESLVRRRFEDQPDGSVITRRVAQMDLHGRHGLRLALAEKADRWILSTKGGVFTGNISKNDVMLILAPPEMPPETILNSIAISPDGRWAVVSPEGEDKLGILDLNERCWVKFIDSDRLTYAVFSSDSQSCWLGQRFALSRLDMHTLKIEQRHADRQETAGFVFVDSTVDGRLMATQDGMAVTLRLGETGAPFLRIKHPLPLSSAWMSLTPDGRYLTSSGMGHVQQVWDLARLAVEMKKLGLPWRGPDLGATDSPQPVTSLRIEP